MVTLGRIGFSCHGLMVGTTITTMPKESGVIVLKFTSGSSENVHVRKKQHHIDLDSLNVSKTHRVV